jgi:segregation and condensation protein B
MMGRKAEAGRPMLYGTSQQFLEHFGLRELGDLPTLREINELIGITESGAETPPSADGPQPAADGPQPAADAHHAGGEPGSAMDRSAAANDTPDGGQVLDSSPGDERPAADQRAATGPVADQPFGGTSS